MASIGMRVSSPSLDTLAEGLLRVIGAGWCLPII